MAHPYPFTGLYKTSKHDARFHLYRLRETLEMGWTCWTEAEIDRLLEQWKSSYLGCDYQLSRKNSIHFAQFLLEQLSTDGELKLVRLPSCNFVSLFASLRSSPFTRSDVARLRRWTATLEFLRVFDREGEIAEVNILYFLYMKFEGELIEICRVIQCQTVEKVTSLDTRRCESLRVSFSSSNARCSCSSEASAKRNFLSFLRLHRWRPERSPSVSTRRRLSHRKARNYH